jgi:hypothetical protein
MGEAIKQISDVLERIFRHLLPGVCLVIAAQLSHPSWFCGVDFRQSEQLLLLAIIAVSAGNIWYIFHRYSVHQLIDWAMYLLSTNKPRPGYHKWLIDHISGSFSRPECRGVEMRAAQTIFMSMVCEIAFISACYHEQCSWFGRIGRCNCPIAIVALVFFCCAIWQHYVLFNVDRKIVATPPAAR